MSTDKTAAEIALDEIAAACGCPPWEYPGQVVRDVLGLVKANETLTASLATVTRKRDEARRERDDHARFLYAAGYTPCNSEACNCGSWHGGHVEELRARLRHVTQMLVGAVGAGGPMSAEAAAEKAVATIMERDELRAALLNERGEGEPPSEGWTYAQGTWCKGDWTIWRDTETDGIAVWVADWGGESMFDRPTARECMCHVEADAALAAGGKA